MNRKLKYSLTLTTLLLSISLFISCESNTNSADVKSEPNVSDKQNQSEGKKPSEDVKPDQNKPSTNQNDNNKPIVTDEKAIDMGAKAKDYILNGQGDKSEAEKLKWSNSFLNAVDFKKMYNNYINDAGAPDDVVWFSKYITLYSPAPKNWEELFKNDIYNNYGVKITKINYLETDRYTAYTMIEGKERAYVVVNSRTGYYHGTSDDTTDKVSAKVKIYEGSYRDSNIFKVAGMEKPLDIYYDLQISNVTDTSFDFAVYQRERVYSSKELKYERKIIFLKNKAVFIGDGKKAAFYGNDYTLNFTFPDTRNTYPDVVEIRVNGFKTIEGIEFLNNGVPGHEFN